MFVRYSQVRMNTTTNHQKSFTLNCIDKKKPYYFRKMLLLLLWFFFLKLNVKWWWQQLESLLIWNANRCYVTHSKLSKIYKYLSLIAVASSSSNSSNKWRNELKANMNWLVSYAIGNIFTLDCDKNTGKASQIREQLTNRMRYKYHKMMAKKRRNIQNLQVQQITIWVVTCYFFFLCATLVNWVLCLLSINVYKQQSNTANFHSALSPAVQA